MEYYDLVDTLVTVRKTKNFSEYYRALMKAEKAYNPIGNFKILTAQPALAAKLATELGKILFPNCLGVHVVSSTAGKVIWLRTLKAESYTDNDPKVLRKIAKELPDLKLYVIQNGVRKPYNGRVA
jgi:hypothetical protein